MNNLLNRDFISKKDGLIYTVVEQVGEYVGLRVMATNSMVREYKISELDDHFKQIVDVWEINFCR